MYSENIGADNILYDCFNVSECADEREFLKGIVEYFKTQKKTDIGFSGKDMSFVVGNILLNNKMTLRAFGKDWGYVFYEKDNIDVYNILKKEMSVLSFTMKNIVTNMECDDNELKNRIELAFSTLSYSETEAVKNIFSAFESDEKTVVTSKVADKAGFARSVVVNALRKLESGMVLESHSMGVKGTHIKIKNKYLKDKIAGLN